MVYVIEVSEDGDIRISGMTKESFLEALNGDEETYQGGVYPIDPSKLRLDVEEKDPMSWGVLSILAIEGNILIPRPVSRVTKWAVG